MPNEEILTVHIPKKDLPPDHRTFGTAEEFLDVMKGESHRGTYDRPDQWGFRGQGNADWLLIPSALRPGTIVGFSKEELQYESKGEVGCPQQLTAELSAVRQFAELTDKVGLPLPSSDDVLRLHPLRANGRYAAVGDVCGTAEWPTREYIELVALAQHHGVPTRFLDFTFRPLVAAYFAASSVHPDANHISVFAFNLDFISQHGRIKLIRVSRSRNSFLQVQHGFFLHCWQDGSGLAAPLEVLVEGHTGKCPLKKLSLPASESQRLLQLLALDGIDAVHLQPTYDNVVRSLKG